MRINDSPESSADAIKIGAIIAEYQARAAWRPKIQASTQSSSTATGRATQAILCTCFPCTKNTKNMMFTTIKSVMPHISQRRGLAKFAPTIMRQIRGKPPISKRIEMPPAHIPTSAQINAGKVIALSHSMLKTCAAEATIMLPAESPTKNINIAI